MHPDLPPQIEVTISPVLRRLLADSRELSVADCPAPVSPPIAPVVQARWQRVRLRRDGLRPLVFDGVPVFTVALRTATELGEAEQSIRLFCTETGDVVAEIAVMPPPEMPARPVHRC